MEVRNLPLNKKVTVIAEKFIIAIAKRINSNEAIVSYINLENHREVLRILEKIDNGGQILRYVDPEYWDIYVDGDYITDFDISLFKEQEVEVKASTLDKSLEIANFGKGKEAPPNLKRPRKIVIGNVRQ